MNLMIMLSHTCTPRMEYSANQVCFIGAFSQMANNFYISSNSFSGSLPTEFGFLTGITEQFYLKKKLFQNKKRDSFDWLIGLRSIENSDLDINRFWKDTMNDFISLMIKEKYVL